MARLLNVGYIQLAPVLGDLEQTIHKLEKLFERCPKDAELVVLPELCNSGYNFSSKEQAFEYAEAVEDSRFLNYLIEKSRQKNMHIVTGLNERHEDKIYNSAVFLGPKGILGTYRKLHLFFKEKLYFEPGDSISPILELNGWKIGILICFDWLFPEAWRSLALKGVNLICHPSNLIPPDFGQQSVPVHALINHIYIVTANRIGREGKRQFTGLSLMASPKGEVLVQASRDKEEVEFRRLDISLSQDKMITPTNHVFEDRRPEFYDLDKK